jgi:serralysin
MIHDVLAIQALYGVERNTRATDTVYGFNSTANRSVFDFTENKHPILCIWDAGGTDTLDLSGFNTRSRIDLRAGQFSDCDGMTKNIAIAFGAIIENAEGGGASDSILGNTGRNELHGNGGADTINGSGGGDTIFGGGGNDRIIGGNGGDRLYGGAGADTFVFTNLVTAYDVIKDFEDGTDSIVIDTDAASRVGDLTITGQGTESVRVEIGGAVIVVKSDSSIFLGHADFTFA